MSAMSIATLLQAAEYLDRREREAEHGYATTLPSPGEEDFHQNTSSTKNSTRLNKNTKKPQGNR
jgi:MAX dimerization protein